ncbi:MAG TPA: metallophosphoesterase [Vicinamibacterales bacterium]|nr:metallophosphoesterase [Vicinamibacterales bacterium]
MQHILGGRAARPIKVSALAVSTLGLAFLALLAPLSGAEYPAARVGVLLGMAACVEALHALRRSTAAARRQATVGAMISMAIALFLINAPFVAGNALRLLVAGWFALDAVRHGVGMLRRGDPRERTIAALAALGNTAVTVLLLMARGGGLPWGVAVAGALRIAGIAWNIMVAPVFSTTEADESVMSELGLADQPEAALMAREVEASERLRAPFDRGWTMSFVATLFAIHVGRMSTDWTLLGLLSPAVAVLGDMLIAVLITLLVFNPLYLSWRGPTRWIERRVWHWYLGALASGSLGWGGRLAKTWLEWRLKFAIRMRAARYSIRAALDRGLQAGLPVAAIIAATAPVWGMSWYFDTENWAAGMWNAWAESRTDSWRDAMVRAVQAADRARGTASSFAVEPQGVASGDFSFVVIGDPGEGDASQHVLRDQLLSVSSGPDVRFVVVSSDVVYPTGAMKDYEAKFWLPFKGIVDPVYAIPGNHDWYDALEGFAATFLEADAARASLHARVEADLRATSTTDDRIEALIGEAARLRIAYGVPTGFQRAPFFELQTDRFALIAIDTGVLRRIDPSQEAWLEAALTRAAGKLTMAIVGHPFFAGGHNLTLDDEEFARLKERLVRRGVTILMAGDTHDLEYYVEPGSTPLTTVHYFVNGGGGAYLSFGTSLAWPAEAATADWAYYPNLEAVTDKIVARTPWWKRPAWWWTEMFGAWPFTAEWLSAAFDYNVAPFFQSFVEVRVERSSNRVRILPYGVHGRLRWDEMASSEGRRSSTITDQPFVEWVVPMRPQETGR